MDEYNLAEAFLDPTEVQRHVVDIGDFQKIPFAELAGLGGLIAELIPQFRTVTETINTPMEGLFRAINPKTGEVMPDLMYKSKQVAEAFVGSLKHANGEFDQAAFVKVPGVKEVTTSVAAINPATLMIAAGIMAMSKKLDNIQEGQKNIMGFLALNETGGYEQLSYLNGQQVPFGTQGATRPDVVQLLGDHIEAIEVKYYNLESQASLGTLYSELEREVAARVANLPAGSTQRIILDVTGRGFTEATCNAVKTNIWKVLENIYPNIPIEIVGL